MTRCRAAALLVAALAAACGRSLSTDDGRALESRLLTRGLDGRSGLAPATFRPPIRALAPAHLPQLTGTFGEDAETLPAPCRRGVLRWRMRPDRVDYAASASLRLWPQGQKPGEGDTPLMVSLGRGGGTGKKAFRIHGGGSWTAGEPQQAAVLEGVELEITCAWDLAVGTFALSVTDAFHRTLLDDSLPLQVPPNSTVGSFTLTRDVIRSHRGKDPRLDLVLRPFEFWNLDPLP